MNNIKYLNISEASKILGLKEHKIRYWDSIDPKTNKYRIEGISTKSKGGTRYFNTENLKKLKKLKEILYEDSSKNYSIQLANKILSSKRERNLPKSNASAHDYATEEKSKKIEQILNKMKLLLINENK